jgi:diguanylate cyclase (GGDEF)-like protein/PAS domain S-box-containing protein
LLDVTCDYRIVVLSGVLALSTAYVALDLAARISAVRSQSRLLWLILGSVAIGVGIWATHYVGTLAFSFSVPILFHYPNILLALTVAIAASAVFLICIGQRQIGLRQNLTGGILIAVLLCSMHYIDLHAVVLPAVMEYPWHLVVLVAAFSLLLSFFALFLAFRERNSQGLTHGKFLAALVLGCGVPLMRRSAMQAVRFHVVANPFPTHHTIRVSSQQTVAITFTALFMMSLAIIAALLERANIQQVLARGAIHDEARFQTLAEAIPQIVWICDSKGCTTYLNKRWYEMAGAPEVDDLEERWLRALHPDDRAPCMEKWSGCLVSGQTFEIEYRLHDAAKGYRWYLNRAVPLRDEAGVIQQWFGTCTDIEEQKLYQQTLERQIKERTEELASANTRLQQEMWEKDSARRSLDEQNEKMMDTLKQRSQRATLLAKMGELMQSCQSREEVFAAALGFAPKIFPNRRGAVALFNSSRNLVEVAGQWRECKLPVMSFEPDDCWALRTGHPHLVVAGDTTARCGHAGGVENTYLCVPILAQGEALGILHIQATDENPSLGEAELSFKTTFAAQVGLSVANIRLREALRAQSTKDPLTGLYNRRYLQEMLDREIRRAIRSEQHLGVLMLDLDHFKKFNDTYGHEAGDAVLRETASFLVRSIRVEDFVCRYGGEEFVVVLPTADLRAAEARAERIRSKLRDLVVMHDGRSLGLITVSVGVAALPDHGTSEKELLQAADAALYRAKREGRDRVIVADPITALQLSAAAASKT